MFSLTKRFLYLLPSHTHLCRPITKFSSEELVAFLKQENINQKVLDFLTKNEVNGLDFAEPNCVAEIKKHVPELLGIQVSSLQRVHSRLCASTSDEAAVSSDEPSHPSLSSPLSAPNPSTLELLRVQIDKFPELENATCEQLKTAVAVLEGLKKRRGYVGSYFTIIHDVVSGIHNANGGAKRRCLKLIAKVSRLVAGPNASFLFNPPRDYVPLFKEVITVAKEAKRLIAKFIPLTKEDETFLSNLMQAAALFGAYEKDFDLIHKKINNIHIEISSAMGLSTNQIMRYGPSGKIDLRAQARDVSDMKTFINEIKESCRLWYNDVLELEVASSSPTKQIVKLENLFVDLKIQRQVNASSIAENASGEYADTSNLQKHLFQSSLSPGKSTISNFQQMKLLTLVEGPAGCGKTTCCQEFTRLQQIDGAFIIFIALKELFDCGQMTSIDDILSFVRAPPVIRECLPEILKYNIPIVWILDGFDEVMLTDDGGVRFFLKNFVDPTTRKKNIENKVLPDFVRPCDAVIISSRENRVDNKDVVVLNNLEASLAPDRWVIQRWRRDAISRYVRKHFEKAGKPLSGGELTAIVDKTLSPQMQGFHGIPLFIKLICDSRLEDPTFDVSKISPPFLYQKNLRQAFDRAKVRISYLLNQDASWMKYENDRDKLFNDIVLPNASKRAFDEFVNHEGTALTFKVPQNEAVPLWLSVMLEMGLLQRDKQSDNSFKFPHRTFIEYLAAKHVSLHAGESLSRIPFKDELNTTWLLMCQLANQRETDGFFSKLTTAGLTSKQLAKFVAKTFVSQYLNISDEQRHSEDENKISTFVSELSLKLLIQIAVSLPGDLLMDEINSAHGVVFLSSPSHLKWMIEWCGVYGAIKVLKWIDNKYPSAVNVVQRFPDDVSDQNRIRLIRARCRLGLARALQSRGVNASSLVEECIDFYLPRAGDLEAEDAVAADSHSALQQVLKKRPWKGNAERLSKLVLTCISKRKSHPNLLASLLVFLQLDVQTEKNKCMSLLQLALFFAPEKLEIQNEDKSVEVFNLTEKVEQTQRWIHEPLMPDFYANGDFMEELLKSGSDLVNAFKECSEVEVEEEENEQMSDDDNCTWKTQSATLLSSEDFVRCGFSKLKYGRYTTHYITDVALQHLTKLSSLRSLKLARCYGITDTGLQHLAKMPSLQSLNIMLCDRITDSGLQHVAELPSLQSLNVTWCDNITDTGLQHLIKVLSLETLNLSNCNKITGNGLQHLAKLPSLQSLNLMVCDKITDSGLQHLAELPSLQTLNLGYCDKITDDGLEHLAKLLSLQSLDLRYCKLITDGGLKHLAKLSSLQSLDLHNCDKITKMGCCVFSFSTKVIR